LEFVTPELAWDYGAITRVLEPPETGAQILRVTAQASAGVVGVSLAKTNGSALMSEERVLTPEKGEMQMYFRMPAGLRPISILVRNYDNDGVKGVVRVKAVDAVEEADLDPSLAGQVSKAV
jgi:hypothetical protein